MNGRYTVRAPDGASYGPADVDLLRRWAGEGRIARESVLVDEAGAETLAVDHPALGPVLRAPPIVRGAVPDAPKGDATGGLIPYKNGPALASYYVGIGAWIALLLGPLGAVVGIIAIVLGVKGLRRYKAEPAVHGVAHAWVGIVCGVLVTMISLAVTALIVIGLASGG